MPSGLEGIITCYLDQLNKALGQVINRRNTIMNGLYDQTVRNYNRGSMAEFLYQPEIHNEDYVYQRLGKEAKNIRENYLKNSLNTDSVTPVSTGASQITSKVYLQKYVNWKIDNNKLLEILMKEELQQISLTQKELHKYLETSKFRLSREIYQGVYNRYCLSTLLAAVGFVNHQIKTAFDSNIKLWNYYALEVKDGLVYNPDFLFIETFKV